MARAELSYVSDPCVYLNDSANGVESVDTNSNEGECTAHGGKWVPAGWTYSVGPNGSVNMSPSDATAIFSTVANSFPGWLTAQYYFSPGTCAALNHGGIVVLGVGLVIDNPIVTGVGAVGTIASYIGCP